MKRVYISQDVEAALVALHAQLCPAEPPASLQRAADVALAHLLGTTRPAPGLERMRASKLKDTGDLTRSGAYKRQKRSQIASDQGPPLPPADPDPA